MKKYHSLTAIVLLLLSTVFLSGTTAGQDSQIAQESIAPQPASKSRVAQANDGALTFSHADVVKDVQCSACHASIHEPNVSAHDFLVARLIDDQNMVHTARTNALIQHFYAPSKNEPVVSDYWIGIVSEPANDASLLISVRVGENQKQVKSFVKGGLKITSVIENGPAKKAGFLVGDIIYLAGDVEVGTVNELVSIISEKKENELEGVLIRDSQLMPFTVTPELRPKSDEEAESLDFPKAPTVSWRLRQTDLVDPGIRATIPDGGRVVVEIDKVEPAKIKLELKGKKYSIQEAQTKKAPGYVRDWAAIVTQRYTLNPVKARQKTKERALKFYDQLRWSYESPKNKPPQGGDKLDQILNRLDELTKEVDALKGKLENSKR